MTTGRGKSTGEWIDRKETVGEVGVGEVSLSCPRPSIYLGNLGENFSAGKKKTEKEGKTTPYALSKDLRSSAGVGFSVFLVISSASNGVESGISAVIEKGPPPRDE